MPNSPEDTLPLGLVLGRLDDCPMNRVIKLLFDGDTARVLAVRRGDTLRAYLNVCPHMGLPLDDISEGILSADGLRLVCSAHNAAFSVETGEAVRGLPPDCGLVPVPLVVTPGGDIVTI